MPKRSRRPLTQQIGTTLTRRCARRALGKSSFQVVQLHPQIWLPATRGEGTPDIFLRAPAVGVPEKYLRPGTEVLVRSYYRPGFACPDAAALAPLTTPDVLRVFEMVSRHYKCHVGATWHYSEGCSLAMLTRKTAMYLTKRFDIPQHH